MKAEVNDEVYYIGDLAPKGKAFEARVVGVGCILNDYKPRQNYYLISTQSGCTFSVDPWEIVLRRPGLGSWPCIEIISGWNPTKRAA